MQTFLSIFQSVDPTGVSATSISNTTYLLFGLLFSVLVLAVVFIVLRFNPSIVRPDVVSKQLRTADMSTEIIGLKASLTILLGQLVAADDLRREVLIKTRESEVQIAELRDQVRLLREQLEAKQLIPKIPTPRKLCVLGVWSSAPGMDAAANANSVALAGVDYTELSGERASMEWIMYELPRKHYTTLEAGVRGNVNGTEMADGVATGEWWANLASAFPALDTFLIFADNSGGQNTTSLADALFRIPTVKAVISLDAPVEDAIARRYSRMLYARMGEGMAIADAAKMAKLAVGTAYGKFFTLRERE